MESLLLKEKIISMYDLICIVFAISAFFFKCL